MVYSLTIIFICSDICQSLWTSETNGSEAEFDSFYKALGSDYKRTLRAQHYM